MAVPGLFVAHSAQIETAAGVSAWIDEIQSSELNPGLELFEESGSGEPDRDYVAIKARMPVLNISTFDLALLGTIGLNGLAIAADADDPGFTAWGKFIPNEGVRDAIATTSHLKLLCTDGLIVPSRISAGHNQAAIFAMILHAIKGSGAQSGTYPFSFTKDTAITSGGGATDLLYTAGAVKFAYAGPTTRLVQGIMDISLDFGIDVLKLGSDGEVDPTYVAIGSRKPRFEFSTYDVELIDEVGEGGLSCTSFAMYFRKVSQNGERVAAATGEHISAIATKGMLTPGAVSLPNTPGMAKFTFTPSKDTNILTLATNAAIPTS